MNKNYPNILKAFKEFSVQNPSREGMFNMIAAEYGWEDLVNFLMDVNYTQAHMISILTDRDPITVLALSMNSTAKL